VAFVEDHDLGRWQRHAGIADASAVQGVGARDLHELGGVEHASQLGGDHTVRDAEGFEPFVNLPH